MAAKATIYEPKTEAGKQLTETVSYPFKLLDIAGEKAADVTREITGSPVAATAVGTAIKASPLLLGLKSIKGSLKSMGKSVLDSGWYRSLTVKERGLVTQSLEDMLNKGYSEGDVLRRWNNPSWREEALRRRNKGEEYPPFAGAGKPEPTGPRITPPGVAPEAPEPVGSMIPRGTPAPSPTAGKGEEPPLALPPGQGFQLIEPKPKTILRPKAPVGTEFKINPITGEPEQVRPPGIESEAPEPVGTTMPVPIAPRAETPPIEAPPIEAPQPILPMGVGPIAPPPRPTPIEAPAPQPIPQMMGIGQEMPVAAPQGRPSPVEAAKPKENIIMEIARKDMEEAAKLPPEKFPIMEATEPLAGEEVSKEALPVSEGGAKQPWMMTRKEFVDSSMDPNNPEGTLDKKTARSLHKSEVQDALEKGKPVPPEVLADYPDLQPTATQAIPPTAQHFELMPEEYPEIDKVAVMQDGKIYTDHTHPEIVVANNLDPEKAISGYTMKETGEFVPAETIKGMGEVPAQDLHTQVNAKQYEKRGPVTAYIVDGNLIRKDIDPEFTNFSYHQDKPYIPENEIWLDKEYGETEYPYFFDNALTQMREMASGKSYDEALKRGDAIEQRERVRNNPPEKGESKPKVVEDLKKELIGTADKGKVQVYLVNGDMIREKVPTFTEGGNDQAYKWVPKNTVIIDDQIVPEERRFVIAHELYERGKMLAGLSYNKAHPLASQIEHEYREDPAKFEASKKFAGVRLEPAEVKESYADEMKRRADEQYAGWRGRPTRPRAITSPGMEKPEEKPALSPPKMTIDEFLDAYTPLTPIGAARTKAFKEQRAIWEQKLGRELTKDELDQLADKTMSIEKGVSEPQLSPNAKDQFALPGIKQGLEMKGAKEGAAPILEGTPLGEAARRAEVEKAQPKLPMGKKENIPETEGFDIASWFSEHGKILTRRNPKTGRLESPGIDMIALSRREGATKAWGKYNPFAKAGSGKGQTFDNLFQELQAEGYTGTIDDALTQLESRLTEGKGKPLSWEKMNATQREEFAREQEVAYLEDRKDVIDSDPEFLKDETFDSLTNNIDDEIMGLDERLNALREELNVQGATPEEIRTALDKERTAYPVQEEPPNLEAIKKTLTESEAPPVIKEPTPETPGDWSKGESRPFAFDPNSTENEGRFRLLPTETIKKDSYFRRKSSTAGVSYLMGKDKPTGKEVTQAIRFDKSVMPEEKAAQWWEENKGRFPFSGGKKAEPTPKSKKVTLGDKAKEFYQPGNIIYSGYWKSYDKVLQVQGTPGEANWSVEVQQVDREGNPVPGTQPRWHSTLPGKGDRVEKAIEPPPSSSPEPKKKAYPLRPETPSYLPPGLGR